MASDDTIDLRKEHIVLKITPRMLLIFHPIHCCRLKSDWWLVSWLLLWDWWLRSDLYIRFWITSCLFVTCILFFTLWKERIISGLNGVESHYHPWLKRPGVMRWKTTRWERILIIQFLKKNNPMLCIFIHSNMPLDVSYGQLELELIWGTSRILINEASTVSNLYFCP